MATPPFRVKAVYDYNSPHDDDLSFTNGQLISVTDEEDADWYYGEYQDQSGAKQQGLFPKNFVERYEPATPPRPSRQQRPKKDTEPPTTTTTVTEAADQVQETSINKTNVQSLPPSSSRGREATTTGPDDDSTVTQATSPTAISVPSGTKTSSGPPPTSSSKAAPPPVADKPAIGSFRDRIAAFNKSTAAPVAPMKPGGLSQGSGSPFIKKPYVAPPPSRNAYVAPPREPPPQRVYRREEDPEVITGTTSNAEEPATALPGRLAASDETGEEQPKPTTLKERIALLQKQQLEQATRHADAAQKKEKPKRPMKKRTDSQTNSGASTTHHDEALGERFESADHIRGQQMESTDEEPRVRNRSSTRRSKSKDASPLATPTASREAFLSDPNDADQSGAADTEDGGDTSTERDDSDEKPRQRVPTLPYRTSAPAERPGPGQMEEIEQASDEEDENEEEEEDEEEEMDPEVKRKMEIRERMAKMSGGMGMAGMFGLPGGMAPMSTRNQKSSGSSAKERSSTEPTSHLDAKSSSSQPLMALPGMQRMRSPEQEERQLEVSKEDETGPRSTIQVREPEEMYDMEDVGEEPQEGAAQSEARAVPPPIPQGIVI